MSELHLYASVQSHYPEFDSNCWIYCQLRANLTGCSLSQKARFMWPTRSPPGVLSTPGGPHVGPMSIAIMMLPVGSMIFYGQVTNGEVPGQGCVDSRTAYHLHRDGWFVVSHRWPAEMQKWDQPARIKRFIGRNMCVCVYVCEYVGVCLFVMSIHEIRYNVKEIFFLLVPFRFDFWLLFDFHDIKNQNIWILAWTKNCIHWIL